MRCGECEAVGLVEPCFCQCCGRPLSRAGLARPDAPCAGVAAHAGNTGDGAPSPPSGACPSCGAALGGAGEGCPACTEALASVTSASASGDAPGTEIIADDGLAGWDEPATILTPAASLASTPEPELDRVPLDESAFVASQYQPWGVPDQEDRPEVTADAPSAAADALADSDRGEPAAGDLATASHGPADAAAFFKQSTASQSSEPAPWWEYPQSEPAPPAPAPEPAVAIPPPAASARTRIDLAKPEPAARPAPVPARPPRAAAPREPRVAVPPRAASLLRSPRAAAYAAIVLAVLVVGLIGAPRLASWPPLAPLFGASSPSAPVALPDVPPEIAGPPPTTYADVPSQADPAAVTPLQAAADAAPAMLPAASDLRRPSVLPANAARAALKRPPARPAPAATPPKPAEPRALDLSAGATPVPVAAPPPMAPAIPTRAESEADLGQAFEVTQVDVRPIVTRQTYPRQPAGASGGSLPEVVVVRVLVSRSGRAVDVRVVRGSKLDRAYDEAAVGAVREWSFTPAQRRSKAVSCWMHVGVSFRSGDGH